MKPLLTLLLSLLLLSIQAQRQVTLKKIDTTSLNIKVFTDSLTRNESTNIAKAKKILHFVSNTLLWLGTDYKSRTVKEILARGGGNCADLAQVYKSMIKSIHLQYRSVAEINICKYTEQRQKTAEQKIKDAGFRMSVFGQQHNDHRWLEVYDDIENQWIPVDPSMNVMGEEQWLKARVWFGKRVTIDTAITNDMIVPFAIFTTSNLNPSELIENRSQHYLITAFNKLYNNKLSELPSWNKWVKLIGEVEDHAKAAFEGKENLHNYSNLIADIAGTYQNLKSEYGKLLHDVPANN